MNRFRRTDVDRELREDPELAELSARLDAAFRSVSPRPGLRTELAQRMRQAPPPGWRWRAVAALRATLAPRGRGPARMLLPAAGALAAVFVLALSAMLASGPAGLGADLHQVDHFCPRGNSLCNWVRGGFGVLPGVGGRPRPGQDEAGVLPAYTGPVRVISASGQGFDQPVSRPQAAYHAPLPDPARILTGYPGAQLVATEPGSIATYRQVAGGRVTLINILVADPDHGLPVRYRVRITPPNLARLGASPAPDASSLPAGSSSASGSASASPSHPGSLSPTGSVHASARPSAAVSPSSKPSDSTVSTPSPRGSSGPAASPSGAPVVRPAPSPGATIAPDTAMGAATTYLQAHQLVPAAPLDLGTPVLVARRAGVIVLSLPLQLDSGGAAFPVVDGRGTAVAVLVEVDSTGQVRSVQGPFLGSLQAASSVVLSPADLLKKASGQPVPGEPTAVVQSVHAVYALLPVAGGTDLVPAYQVVAILHRDGTSYQVRRLVPSTG